jgi:hypothetical protein
MDLIQFVELVGNAKFLYVVLGFVMYFGYKYTNLKLMELEKNMDRKLQDKKFHIDFNLTTTRQDGESTHTGKAIMTEISS